MKKLNFLASALILIGTIQPSFASSLKESFCRPLPLTKVYIENDVKASYPKKVTFKCQYECSDKGAIVQVAGTSTVTVRNINEDATDVVCQGVRIKKVTWGWDFDGINTFYGKTASTPEVKEFSFNQLEKNQIEEARLLTLLKENLVIVAKSYGLTKVPSFIEASKELELIASKLPQDSMALDFYLEQIVEKKGKIELGVDKNLLILNVLNTHASWMLPTFSY